MNANTASGTDGFIGELYTYETTAATQLLHALYQLYFTVETIPDEWTIGMLIPIFKNKGSNSICGNYTGITLICVAIIIVAGVPNERLTPLNTTHNIISDMHGVFQTGTGSEYLYLLLWTLLNHNIIRDNNSYEQRQEETHDCEHNDSYTNNNTSCLLQLDIQTTFDSVWRKAVWVNTRYLGITGK